MEPRIEGFRRAAARWAGRYLLSEKDFLGTIRSTRVETLRYVRLRARGKTRRIVSRFGQAYESSRPAVPARGEDFDPWQESGSSLHTKTRQVVHCETCGGHKRVVCPTCSGRTRVRCSSCIGGVQISLKTGKPINCKSCRGKGERSCPSCRTGTVTCQQCEGRGRMLHWLDIDERDLAIVFESPHNSLAQAVSAFPFESPAGRLPVAPIRSWSGPSAQLPADVEAFRSAVPWSQRIDSRHDRVGEIDFESFTAESAFIEYEVLGRRATVEVKAWDQTVAEPAESSGPLWRRLFLLGLGAAGALAAGMLLAFWYGGRHSYLQESSHRSLLLAMAVALGMTLLWPLSRLGFADGGGTRMRWTWLPVLLVAGAQVATAATGYPSLRQALLFEEQGNGAAALREAAACADLRRDAERCSELHDRVRLAAARSTAEPEDAWRSAAEPFYSVAMRQQAEEHAREVTLHKALALESDNRYADLDALLKEVDAGRLRSDPRFPGLEVRLHRRKLAGCFPRLDTRCVRSALANAKGAGVADADLAEVRRQGRQAAHEALASPLWTIRSSRPFAERLAACAEIEVPLAFLAAIEPDDRLQDETRTKCSAAESGQREAERKAQERERAIAARRQASRNSAPLLCRDGTLSPSCVCGGSRRGCCSHHGGVAGCSQ